MNDYKLQLEASICRDSLAKFFRRSWHVLEPNTPLVWNWHLQAICDHVQALLEHRLSKNNLIINVPPGSSKSRIVSVCVPAWMWTKNPHWRAIFASASGNVSTRDAKYTRDLVTSDWYVKRFCKGWRIPNSQRGTEIFYNTKGGYRRATTTGAGITGERADATFIDDPIDAANADSAVLRMSSIQWHDQAFSSRLNNLVTGTRCLIMQRLHEQDLSGHLLATGLWEHLMIPTEFEEARRCTTSLPWTDPRIVEGELMDKVRVPPAERDRQKLILRARGYAGQHQQRPAAPEGGIIKRTWLKYYGFDPRATKWDQVLMSWDLAFEDTAKADYVVGQVWGRRDADLYLLDQVRDVMDFPATIQAFRALCTKWPKAYWKLVEKKANGPALIQSLRKEIRGIIPVEPQGSKDSRLNSVSADFESGNVYLPEKAPWISDYVEELVNYTTEGSTTHDDQIDSTTQALIRFKSHPRGIELFYSEGQDDEKESVAS
jgi:predicted phage terminase large subunit-like protein